MNENAALSSEKKTDGRFEMPEIELVKFEASDIITNSPEPALFGDNCFAA